MDDSTPEKPKQDESLRTMCPFCLSEIDAHLDIKGRPYWRCEGPPIRNKNGPGIAQSRWLVMGEQTTTESSSGVG